MSKDRTTEFISIVRLLQSQEHRNGFPPSANVAPNSVKQRQAPFAHEFNRCAKEIGQDLAMTYAKLEKLTLLSKKKSIFDDRGSEIEQLSHMIKDDIQHLNQNISKLQDLSRHGKNVPTTARHHLESHSSNVVIGLQSKLAKMSTNFKEVLEIRTENMKHQQERRDKYTSPLQNGSNYIPPRPQNSILLQDELGREAGGSVAIDMPSMELQRRNPHQQMLLIEQQERYIQTRESEVQNIESTIVELGGIFQQLAHMVKEQVIIRLQNDMNFLSSWYFYLKLRKIAPVCWRNNLIE